MGRASILLARPVLVVQRPPQTNDGGYPATGSSRHPASGRPSMAFFAIKASYASSSIWIGASPCSRVQSRQQEGTRSDDHQHGTPGKKYRLVALPEICRLRYCASRQSKISRRSSRKGSASPVSKVVARRFPSKRKKETLSVPCPSTKARIGFSMSKRRKTFVSLTSTEKSSRIFKYRAASLATCSTNSSIPISPGIASAEIRASSKTIL